MPDPLRSPWARLALVGILLTPQEVSLWLAALFKEMTTDSAASRTLLI
jgi:hypothetical protein